MEKVDPVEIITRLRSGEMLHCPECGEGVISAPCNPETSHFFSCDKCDFVINID